MFRRVLNTIQGYQLHLANAPFLAEWKSSQTSQTVKWNIDSLDWCWEK
jgi:hypothetical protein